MKRALLGSARAALASSRAVRTGHAISTPAPRFRRGYANESGDTTETTSIWRETIGKGKERQVDDERGLSVEEEQAGAIGQAEGRASSIGRPYDQGIDYIDAARTWAGVPVPLYTAQSSSSRKRPSQAATQAEGSNLAQERDEASGALEASDTLLRTDAELRTLMMRLASRAERGDVVATMNTCHAIKMRLTALAKETGRTTQLNPPTYVYKMMLKALAAHGEVAICREVLEDMQTTGKEVGIEQLDWLLKAAVLRGDNDEIDRVLAQVAELPHKARSASLPESDPTEAQTILSEDYTRNWTPMTYQNMLLHCQLTHNIEYALALLGAASRRSLVEASSTKDDPESTRGHVPFITQVLNVSTSQSVLSLARECRQARLTADLALWMESGAAMRKLDVRTWMNVLRCCADEDWFPGMALAWTRAIGYGLLSPDEGLLLSVLNCASRAKRPDFVMRALDLYVRYAPSSFTLQEWHLMPLFDAHCWQHDFPSALRTATRIARVTPTMPSQLRALALVKMAGSSPRAAQSSFHAFLEVGRESGASGGVTTEVLNALIRSANHLGLYGMALKLYGARHYVRNELSPLQVELPPLPEFFGSIDLGNQVSLQHVVNEVRLAEEHWRQQGSAAAQSSSFGLRPDVHTFNALLSTAVNMQSPDLGRLVFDELNAAGVKADGTTYERAIVLSVTQPNYEDGFALLEECKMRDIRPTKSAYLALGTRCLHENDERWIGIGKEMTENEYYPGQELQDALLRGNWIDSGKLKPFNSRRWSRTGSSAQRTRQEGETV